MLISNEILERAEIEVRGDWDEFLPPVRIDSRQLQEGDLFWALSGENTDGHQFVEAAFEAGAGAAAVSRSWADAQGALYAERVLFVMDEPLAGLQRLAVEVRRSIGAETICLTGSNGKTTTREMIAAALRAGGHKVAVTKGNYNNHIGVPLTLLNMEGDEPFAVIELGANHVGEIATLAEWAHPEVGLITNIGDAHLGEFGGFEALQAAKGELFDFLKQEEGLAIVNLDDTAVADLSGKVEQRVGYTLKEEWPQGWHGSLYMGRIVEVDGWSRVTLKVDGTVGKLQLPGQHWASAALGAFVTAVEMGVSPQVAMEGIVSVTPVDGRGEIVELANGVEIMDETYNANVASVEAMVQTLSRREGQRIVILGDIFELGEFEEDEHRRIGRIDDLSQVDHVFFVGDRMGWAAEEAEFYDYAVRQFGADDVNEIVEAIAEVIEPGAGIVVKGSRKMRLERVIAGLRERLGEQL